MARRLRSVVREHLFEDGLRELIPDRIAADEFTNAAELVLARDPLIGEPIALGSSVWGLPMATVRNEQVTLYYTFSETTVFFLAIRAL